MTAPEVRGDLQVIGRLRQASNATFLVRDEAGSPFVYKPVSGERPLWDFPPRTLGHREVAAWVISERLGFDVVPPTVWADGPLGEGSLQEWVDGRVTDLVDSVAPQDLDRTWLPVASGRDADDRPVVLAHRDSVALRRICLFDLVINNSDRKAGHILDVDGRLLGVDHGVSMGVEPKWRTVLWGFAGRPFDAAEAALLHGASTLPGPVPEGITTMEWDEVAARAEALGDAGVFPAPSGNWPAIPWPPW